MKTKGSHSNEFWFNPGSWATLLLALGFIASAGLYLFLAFKQPTDGWVYETRLDGQLIVVGSPLGDSGPLVPGDKLLAIEGKPATTTDIQFIARPPGWQIGGVAQYLVQRGDQYTLITGLLALVYFGGVALLQSIFGVITGQADSPLVTVISTLVIAALFNPLRLRIQNFIDRNFYRKKYDAQRALAQFAVTARDEVETGRLTSSLLGIVQEAMQPEQVTLWLAEGQPAGATSRRSEKESQHLASNGARNDSRTLAGYNIDN